MYTGQINLFTVALHPINVRTKGQAVLRQSTRTKSTWGLLFGRTGDQRMGTVTDW